MKMYEIQILANKTVVVSATSLRDARKRAKRKFKANPGRLEMYITVEP